MHGHVTLLNWTPDMEAMNEMRSLPSDMGHTTLQYRRRGSRE